MTPTDLRAADLSLLRRFAQRMRCVANDFVVNVRKEPTAIIRKYEQDIKELQQELALHDSLTQRHGIVYQVRIAHCLGACPAKLLPHQHQCQCQRHD